MLLFRRWPSPPTMSERQYVAYRLRLFGALAVWGLCAILVVFVWPSVPLIAKAVILLYLCIVIPDPDTVKRLFTSYAEYKEHGFNR